MKGLVKKMIGMCLGLILRIGMWLPTRKINKESLRKDLKMIEELHRQKAYSPKKYKNRPIDKKVDLSIIVPVYNVEEYLKECIDSLLRQKTKYRFEIIAVNDGSTDGSLKILESYKDKRMKVVSVENGGLSFARNVGLDLAVGEYVSFVDSDDYVTEDYVEVLMRAARENEADVVRAGYFVLKDGVASEARTKGLRVQGRLGEKVLECSGFAWGAAIRRGLFYNVRFPEGYIFEDMIMRPLILARAEGYAEVRKCIYYYRQRGGSILDQVNKRADYRSLDQYYLAREVWEYGLRIGVDERILRLVVFRELGAIMYMRLRKLGARVEKAVFELNAEFVEKMGVSGLDLRGEEDRLFYKCYEKGRFRLYKLAALWRKCQ